MPGVVSVTQMEPWVSTATPVGYWNCPSPGPREPITRRRAPVAPSSWSTRALNVSATYSDPSGATSAPNDPLAALTCQTNTPLLSYFFTCPLSVSHTYTAPFARSTARPLG